MLDAAGVTYVPEVGSARYAETIARIAGKPKADAIVIGTQGAGALRSALMGSDDDGSAASGPCPVTVVK
jgi:nucleotide-binding universal stress UspA family protein